MGRSVIGKDGGVNHSEGNGGRRSGDSGSTSSGSGSESVVAGKSPDASGKSGPKEKEGTVVLPVELKAKASPKKTTKKKEESIGLSVDDVSNILLSVSAVVASRPGCSHWMLNPSECRAIAEPLVKILQETLKADIPNANYIALAMAVSAVFLPRIMITLSTRKELKHGEKGTIKNVDKTGTTNDASTHSISGTSLLADIPIPAAGF